MMWVHQENQILSQVTGLKAWMPMRVLCPPEFRQHTNQILLLMFRSGFSQGDARIHFIAPGIQPKIVGCHFLM